VNDGKIGNNFEKVQAEFVLTTLAIYMYRVRQ